MPCSLRGLGPLSQAPEPGSLLTLSSCTQSLEPLQPEWALAALTFLSAG